jgi:hypothetical protein
MARIVVGSPNLTQPLLLYPGLEPAMLEQHWWSYNKKLHTYKKVLADHCSKSLELQNHLLTAACMSQVESTRLHHKDPPMLGKACAYL